MKLDHFQPLGTGFRVCQCHLEAGGRHAQCLEMLFHVERELSGSTLPLLAEDTRLVMPAVRSRLLCRLQTGQVFILVRQSMGLFTQ